jgi:hypothetical protein
MINTENLIEIIKLAGGWIIYPLIIAYVTIKIARFHYEKGIKSEYLHAKDKIAHDLIATLSGMLTDMWVLANIKSSIVEGRVQENNPEIIQKKQAALSNFYTLITQSYNQFGLMGLYYGTEIVEPLAKLQTEWNEMVNKDDYSKFDTWDKYRKDVILPILQRVHVELKNTVFDSIKSFRIYF